MPAKKNCPFSAEELREMYEANWLSSDEIALKASASRSLALKWIRQAGIHVRTISESRKGRIDPPGELWLREKYWKEKLTLTEIGVLWATLNERCFPFSRVCVTGWMKERGVQIESSRRSDAGIKACQEYLKSDEGKEKLRKTHRKNVEQGKILSSGHYKKLHKAVRLRMRKIRAENLETRQCSHPSCSENITRSRWEFKYDTQFCCVAHRNQYIWIAKRRCLREEKLNRLQQEADALAKKARNDARAKLGLPPEPEEENT